MYFSMCTNPSRIPIRHTTWYRGAIPSRHSGQQHSTPDNVQKLSRRDAKIWQHIFADNNYEPANTVFRKICTNRKNRKFFTLYSFCGINFCINFLEYCRKLLLSINILCITNLEQRKCSTQYDQLCLVYTQYLIVIRCIQKFHKIHRKTPVPESLF